MDLQQKFFKAFFNPFKACYVCMYFYVLCCTAQTQQGIMKNNDLAQLCTVWSTVHAVTLRPVMQ